MNKELTLLMLTIAENKDTFENNQKKVLQNQMLNQDKSLPEICLFAIDRLVPVLYNLRWTLIETLHEDPFLTGANIFSLGNLNHETRVSTILQNALPIEGDFLFIPISSTLTLRMANDKELYDGDLISYDKEHTKWLNQLIFTRSRFIFANPNLL